MLTLSFAGRAPSDAPLHILCLGAHCDDIEIGCAGTLLRLREAHPNARFHWAVFSSDSTRGAETRKSMNLLLGDSCTLETHSYRDGYLPHEPKLKSHFEKLKLFDPDLLFTHFRHDRHQDHRCVAELTWNTFRDHLVLEYEIPKYEGDLGQPNLFVPLDAKHVERKVHTLIESYVSQRERTWFDRETFVSLARLRGLEGGSPTRYAEAFHSTKARLSF